MLSTGRIAKLVTKKYIARPATPHYVFAEKPIVIP
jgi:hypothetical protein